MKILSEEQLEELNYKLYAIREFLVVNNGYNYKIYNHTCSQYSDEPDSNIVEYLDDVIYLTEKLKK